MIDSITKIFAEFLAKIKDVIRPKEPERPDTPPGIDFDAESLKAPTVVTVKGARYKLRGKFKTPSGKPLGAVVHSSISGRSAKSAEAVVRYLAKQGLGCLVMDENGIFYVAENYNYLTDVGFHAGTSAWRGKKALSNYCVGIEICGWGSAAKANGAKDVRILVSQDANQKPGIYQAYTDAQEKSLINFLKYLKTVSPDFDIEFVAGHDEVAPKRKSDPGASLSMTMPELRGTLHKSLGNKTSVFLG